MFNSIDNPANSIHELLEYLQLENIDGDLYRGQLKDYPALIPSLFRAISEPTTWEDEIVRIDEDLHHQRLKDSTQHRLRNHIFHELVSETGIAFGNLLSQQYGLSSECLDVSSSPYVAGFFATRPWPQYKHFADEGTGVIYRFRTSEQMYPSPAPSMEAIARWFEMGVDEEGLYFDDFVREFQEIYVLERDKWFDYEHGVERQVGTVPMSLPWPALLQALQKFKPKRQTGKLISVLLDELYATGWQQTRMARQEGGFIRPKIVYNALVASELSKWHFQEPHPHAHDFTYPKLRELNKGDGFPWPRAIPSAAVKQQVLGVENLRFRDEFTAFYFRHGPNPVTGFYRRELWPEPSEDPAYEFMWRMSTKYLVGDALSKGITDQDMPAIDDPESGLLDRGYKVSNETWSRDARELEDIMRGQWEDARENIKADGGVSKDWVMLSGYYYNEKNDIVSAVRALVRALRYDNNHALACISLGSILVERRKFNWALELYERVKQNDQYYGQALLQMAYLATEQDNKLLALKHAQKAIGHVIGGFKDYQFPEYHCLETLAFIFSRCGAEAELESVLSRYEELGWNAAPLRSHIESIPKI